MGGGGERGQRGRENEGKKRGRQENEKKRERNSKREREMERKTFFIFIEGRLIRRHKIYRNRKRRKGRESMPA